MVRRLHLHDAESPSYANNVLVGTDSVVARYPTPLLAPSFSTQANLPSSALMSYLFLLDVIRAFHFGISTNFTASELFIRMPGSPYQFHRVYRTLVTGVGFLPQGMNSNEDGLLLLVANLSDSLYIHRSFRPLRPWAPSSATSAITLTMQQSISRNPFVPLSPQTELARMSLEMQAALDRWAEHFERSVDKEILFLFYFCKLHLACPDLWLLPHLAGYRPAIVGHGFSSVGHGFSSVGHGTKIVVSDEAMKFTWLILDNIDIGREHPERDQSIWIPVVLFYAALVVWQRLRPQSNADGTFGTLKVLGMFKRELEQLPWACCSEMSRTLDEIMRT